MYFNADENCRGVNGKSDNGRFWAIFPKSEYKERPLTPNKWKQ